MEQRKEHLKELELTPMSDEDIRNVLGANAKIIKYSELSKYSNIDELLPKPKDYCIILFELKENSGHWTCLLKYDNKLEWFDPYGIKYDNELDWISNDVKKKLDQDIPLLSHLLKQSEYNVIYNKTKFQSMAKDISTCGDHCVHRIYRLIHNDLNLDEYTSYMKHIKDEYGLSYDDIVAEFVSTFI